jgi:hypothetical protein
MVLMHAAPMERGFEPEPERGGERGLDPTRRSSWTRIHALATNEGKRCGARRRRRRRRRAACGDDGSVWEQKRSLGKKWGRKLGEPPAPASQQ